MSEGESSLVSQGDVMGGQPFKCPKCDWWSLFKQPLHQHLIDKHGERKGFRLEGVAEGTKIVRDLQRDLINDRSA